MVPSLNRLRDAAGISRVARISGLDRTGVEVACAIRPLGHVLQVSNGKGLTWEDAALGAVLEATELFASERVDPVTLRWGSFDERAQAFGEGAVLHPAALGSAGTLVVPALAGPGVRMAWREGVELFSNRPALVPAQAVHCPPLGGSGCVDIGPIAVAWTTNGLGAHADRDLALLHALLEAAERDQLARTAPSGLEAPLLLSRLLDLRHAAKALPGSTALVSQFEAAGFDVALVDLAPCPQTPGALGLPVAGALLVDREEGPVPLTAGYACRLRPDDAFVGALLEAAQSRLTDIHGAREDLSPAAESDVLLLRNLLRSAGASRGVKALPRELRARTPRAAVRAVLRQMAKAGVDQAVAVDVAAGRLPVQVVRVVVPDFEVSELLL